MPAQEEFVTACIENDVKAAEQLLSDNPGIDVNQPGTDGRTALISACARGHRDIVELLLGHEDIDVNQSRRANNLTYTPLWTACMGGHETISAKEC